MAAIDDKQTLRTKAMNRRSADYDAIKTKKLRIFSESEDSELCFEDMEELDKELEELEGDHIVQEKIFKSFCNKLKIKDVYGSFESFAEHHVSVSSNLVVQGVVSEAVVSSTCKVLVCQHAELKLDEHFYIILTGLLSKYYYEVNDNITAFGHFDRVTNTLLVRPLKVKPSSFLDLRLVIISPNIKVKVTGLTAKSSCMRANILRSLFTPGSDFSIPGLKGTIQHSIFERVILAQEQLNEQKQRVVVFEEMKAQIESIYSMEINYDEFEKELIKAVANIVAWKSKYLGTNTPIYEEKKDLNIRMFLTQIVLTEKAFSSDTFGLSGIVDAIFECKVEHLNSKGQTTGFSMVNFPFELKTGMRVKDEYESQVLIYNYLMREETNDYDNGFGMVYYSNVDNRLDYVSLDHLRFYNLMQQRNKVVSKTRELKHQFENIVQYKLPLRTREVFTCIYCDNKDACVVSDTMHKTYKDPQKLCAKVFTEGGHTMSKKDSVKLVFFGDEDSKTKTLGLSVEKMMANEIDALLDEAENDYMSKNKDAIVSEMAIPPIEDMFSEEEPRFKGFEEIFNQLDMNRVNYFAKWLDMILIEESHTLKNNLQEKNTEYAQYATMLDFDSYDELKVYLRDVKGDRDLLLKFSHFFQQEVEASLFLEKLNRGESITLKHEKMNITLYCVVKGKSIRKKQIFTNEYYLMNLLVQCKKSQVNDAFRNCSGKVNYDKITIGWEYYDPVYVFENKMRGNIVRVLTEERHKELSYVIVDNKPPRYTKIVSDKQLMELLAGFDLNPNQKESIQKSLNTDNFNLILGNLSLRRHARHRQDFRDSSATLLYGQARKEGADHFIHAYST